MITELSTPAKGESDEADENEIPDGSLSQSLARLYQKAIKAEKRVTYAKQGEIWCWYHYAEGFEKRVKEITDGENRINDRQARSQVYSEMIVHLPNITKDNLRKKTQKARAIYTLFSKIGVKKIKRTQTYSANTISNLTGTQIQSIVDSFS